MQVDSRTKSIFTGVVTLVVTGMVVLSIGTPMSPMRFKNANQLDNYMLEDGGSPVRGVAVGLFAYDPTSKKLLTIGDVEKKLEGLSKDEIDALLNRASTAVHTESQTRDLQLGNSNLSNSTSGVTGTQAVFLMIAVALAELADPNSPFNQATKQKWNQIRQQINAGKQ